MDHVDIFMFIFCKSKLIKKIRKKFNSDVSILINNSGGPIPKAADAISLNEWNKALAASYTPQQI